QPDELEGVHTHTFKLKPFKKAKSCDICKQAITKEGLICKEHPKDGWPLMRLDEERPNRLWLPFVFLFSFPSGRDRLRVDVCYWSPEDDGRVPVPAAYGLSDLSVAVLVVYGEVDRGVVAGILARNLAAWTPRLWAADRGSL
ncbi:hypothetical protein GBF38_008724, partial [Nibea albiflora]